MGRHGVRRSQVDIAAREDSTSYPRSLMGTVHDGWGFRGVASPPCVWYGMDRTTTRGTRRLLWAFQETVLSIRVVRQQYHVRTLLASGDDWQCLVGCRRYDQG